jgi:hypothetical protein
MPPALLPFSSGLTAQRSHSDSHPSAVGYDDLVPWTIWKEKRDFNEMIVPHVEVGYPGPLPLRLVGEIISVEITEDPQSHAALLRKAWNSN